MEPTTAERERLVVALVLMALRDDTWNIAVNWPDLPTWKAGFLKSLTERRQKADFNAKLVLFEEVIRAVANEGGGGYGPGEHCTRFSANTLYENIGSTRVRAELEADCR